MSENNEYDYVIVGAGPSGLTLAWCLTKIGKRILLIDREKTIGGCHRVRRIRQEQIFTEHGPRIYSSNYFAVEMILRDMRIDPANIFTPYLFSTGNMVKDVVSIMNWNEFFAFARAFLGFMVTQEPSKKETVLEFLQKNNFTKKTADVIDRICRLTDGAGVARYTMFEFLQLLNQNAFYKILQPQNPNDLDMFSKWREKLLETKKVDFLLDTSVVDIEEGKDGKISAVYVQEGSGNSNNGSSGGWTRSSRITGKNFILAIPLTNIVQLLGNSGNPRIRNSFGSFSNFGNFARDSEYITYIPITFHWNRQIEIPKIWGSPQDDWDIANITLSDYMNFMNPNSRTVMSTCISSVNKVSSYTGKTANQSTRKELIKETLRQLRQNYNLPEPDLSIISPGIFRNETTNRWETQDKAFILTTQGYFKDQKSQLYSNLFNVGPHNGHSPYNFTAMESAVDNALYLLHSLYPKTQSLYPIKGPVTINGIIKVIILLLIILISVYYYRYFR